MPPTTNAWLIVFVKAPSAGVVKTRLQPLLSPEETGALYRGLVQDTLAVCRQLRTLRLAVAYAANREFPDLAWLGDETPMFLQHGRALGERLAHAFEWAFSQGAARVLALGSDAPELSAAWIRRGAQALDTYDVVLGPTHDGGYHLIGLTTPRPELFADMPWSTSHLFSRTLAKIDQLRLSVRCLESIADLDTPADVRAYLAHQQRARRRTHTARLLRPLRERVSLSSPRVRTTNVS